MPRAVRFDRYGGVEELYVTDVPAPVAAPAHVVVRVVTAGVNPGEIGVREGFFRDRWPATFPSGQGSDLAGLVEEIGEGVEGLALGDAVMGWSDKRSAQAELVSVPAAQLTPKPDGLAWDVAGSLSVAGFTALALRDAATARAGDTVLVTGAAGGVGILTAQLVRRSGARVIGLASPPHHDLLHSLGIEPLDYHGDDLEERILSLLPDGPTAVLDTHGGGYVDLGIALGVPAERIVTITDMEAAERHGTTTTGQIAAQSAQNLAGLARLVAAGELVVPIHARFPLENVQDAYRELARRHSAGKIVLDVS